ncbi:aromatic amino acid ammonia-lyase, partial [Salibacteraceae bacterium]|nr:aromatic amino acid ammonia-lyase [Salibacteraceae bacterium]
MTILENKHYSLDDIGSILSSNEPISLGSDLGASVLKGRAFLEDFIERAEKPIYGINTGFGSLCDVRIDTDQLGQLQENLVKSHACGLGREVDHDIVRTMLLLKVLGLSKGNSGIRMETITMLIELFNRSIIPVVYEQGSLGASGDLAPLAHLALPLLGLGEVWYKGSKCDASSALDAEGLSSISLGAKEGLALLNGTQFMSAHGVKILNGLSHWMPQAEKVAALSLDAYDGRPEPFDDAVHTVRPHDGQRETAAR